MGHKPKTSDSPGYIGSHPPSRMTYVAVRRKDRYAPGSLARVCRARLRLRNRTDPDCRFQVVSAHQRHLVIIMLARRSRPPLGLDCDQPSRSSYEYLQRSATRQMSARWFGANGAEIARRTTSARATRLRPYSGAENSFGFLIIPVGSACCLSLSTKPNCLSDRRRHGALKAVQARGLFAGTTRLGHPAKFQ